MFKPQRDISDQMKWNILGDASKAEKELNWKPKLVSKSL